jgi:hypothetical protein
MLIYSNFLKIDRGLCVGFVLQGLHFYDTDAATLRFIAQSEAAFL